MTKDNIPSFIQIDVSINGEAWKEVETLEDHAPEDHVFTINRDTGTVFFGDGKHGQRPSAGSRIEATYRTGGGSAGNIIAFTWTADESHRQKVLSATLTTLPDSFRLSLYQGRAHSWRWRFVTWLCDALKAGLLDSLTSKR